jgi:hypothetical protein
MMTALRYFIIGVLLFGAGMLARQYHTLHYREDLVQEIQGNLTRVLGR